MATLSQMPDFTFKHTNQADVPVYASTALLKADLDSQAAALRAHINGTMSTEFAAHKHDEQYYSTASVDATLSLYATGVTVSSNYYTKNNITSSYYTTASVDSTLSNYATALTVSTNYYTKNNITSSYYTTASVDATLSLYATGATVSSNYYTKNNITSSYYTTGSVDSTLSLYATGATVSTNYYTKNYITSSYYTTASVDTTLSNYATALTVSNNYYTKNNITSSYYTTGSINTTLSLYATTATLSNYATVATLSNYATVATLSNYASVTTLSNYASVATLSNYATVATLTNYASITTLSNYASVATLSNYATVATLSNYATSLFSESSLKTSGYTVTVTDLNKDIICNGTLTVTLPTISSISTGWRCRVSNNNSGLVTVNGESITCTIGIQRTAEFIFNGNVWTSLGNVTGLTVRIDMLKFFAIPAADTKVRLKIGKPSYADGVMIRYKTTGVWTAGDDTSTGTLVATITDTSSYSGDNNWYEATGLTDGTLYYFKAFPYIGTVYDLRMGVNESQSKAGGLYMEYTMDSITGTTLNDTSGNGRNGTISGATTQSGIIGNALKANGSSQYVTIPAYTGTDKTWIGWVTTGNSVTGTQIVHVNDGNTAGHNWGIDISDGTLTGYTATVIANTRYPVCFRDSYSGAHSVDGQPRLFTNRSIGGNWFGGAIDQMRVYSRLIEDYERDNIFNSGNGC